MKAYPRGQSLLPASQALKPAKSMCYTKPGTVTKGGTFAATLEEQQLPLADI